MDQYEMDKELEELEYYKKDAKRNTSALYRCMIVYISIFIFGVICTMLGSSLTVIYHTDRQLSKDVRNNSEMVRYIQKNQSDMGDYFEHQLNRCGCNK